MFFFWPAGQALFQSVLEENLWTCPKCDHHFRVPARTYLGYLVDADSFEERFANLVAEDPLEFRDAKMRYPDRLAAAQRDTGHPAGPGEHGALGQRLAKQSAPARAQGKPHRRLPLPAGGADQQ